jgi:hypothetical protein
MKAANSGSVLGDCEEQAERVLPPREMEWLEILGQKILGSWILAL